MKLMYLLATFAVVLVMMASCTRQSVTGYTLTAAIDGIPDGSHVQLFPVSHGHEKPVADTTVVDGKFIFKGVADEPLAVRLMVKDAYGSMPLMLENGSISVEGKVTSENLNGTVNYNFSQVSVTGSPLTDKYVKLLSTRDALDSIYVTNVIVERALNFKGINTYYMHTTHGVLCKLDGKDAIDSANFRTLSTFKWDCCFASSDIEKYVYAGMFGIPIGKMHVIGMPKNDILVHYTEDYRSELRKRIGIPEGKKAILYAPTFREEANFKEVFDVDVNLWKQNLGDDYVLLYRAHPVISSDTKQNNDFFIDVTNYEVVEDIMIASDLLVSDYSGIIFDYCIMDKPIFLWPYDYDKYNAIRGLYFDIRKELLYKEDQGELTKVIKEADFKKVVEEYVIPFKNKYETEYGNATSKALDLIYNNIQ